MVESIQEGSAALDLWLSANRLCLSQNKIQYIWLGSRSKLAKSDAEWKGLGVNLRFPNVHFLLLFT